MPKPKLDTLSALLLFWQRRLRLQDWTITAEIAGTDAIGTDRWADVVFVAPKRVAHIRILPETERVPCSAAENDATAGVESVEVSLVHELLHLHLCYLDMDEAMTELVAEQTINALASALVALRHGAP